VVVVVDDDGVALPKKLNPLAHRMHLSHVWGVFTIMVRIHTRYILISTRMLFGTSFNSHTSSSTNSSSIHVASFQLDITVAGDASLAVLIASRTSITGGYSGHPITGRNDERLRDKI